MDSEGNAVKSIKGVTQPLHQIVHSTKFLEDDDQRIDQDSEEEEEDEEEDNDEDEEWGGIAEEDIEADDDSDEDAADFEGDLPEGDVPLEWDDLFAQAVGEAESGQEEVEEDDDEEEEVEVVIDEPGSLPLKGAKPSPKKRGE
jgi:hypothetical protein